MPQDKSVDIASIHKAHLIDWDTQRQEVGKLAETMAHLDWAETGALEYQRMKKRHRDAKIRLRTLQGLVCESSSQIYELLADKGSMPGASNELRIKFEQFLRLTGLEQQPPALVPHETAACVADAESSAIAENEDRLLIGDLVNHETFYSKFYQDIDKARKSVIIFSPYATTNRGNSVIDRLRTLIHYGTSVSIYTKPTSDHKGPMRSGAESVLARARRYGINICFRDNLHEKLAIIDSCICWEGSLNILSHSNTTEIMRRIESRSAIRQVLKVVAITD